MSLVKIDGKPYRLMGASPANAPALAQTSLSVLPTRTLYRFEGAGISLALSFITAALPEDIDLIEKPFVPEQLLARVRAAIDRATAAAAAAERIHVSFVACIMPTAAPAARIQARRRVQT